MNIKVFASTSSVQNNFNKNFIDSSNLSEKYEIDSSNLEKLQTKFTNELNLK